MAGSTTADKRYVQQSPEFMTHFFWIDDDKFTKKSPWLAITRYR